MSYDPNKVNNVVVELEDNAHLLGHVDQGVIATAREYLDNSKEVPRWLLVKLSLIVQKTRS